MSNQLKVKVVSSKVVLPDSVPGVDTNNLIAEISFTTKGYTATEDCMIVVQQHSNSYIDGQRLAYSNSPGAANTMCFVLKKGQKIVSERDYGNVISIFGLKY